ncbi:VOC family protein [Dongia rigui]|uniref:VOC family protein n=1 Tax=Dongia rigui TaxID=940149 RepID=A0ABU5E086_9PROT|nr:VOC family protein [Dongia rigui]MDY0872999.1 VOC family protein [Dongia rigui]
MKPRVSLVTLGVGDLARARRFYETGLGWKVSGASNEHVVFIQLGGGVALGLFGRSALAEDAHLADAGTGFSGITLAQNLESKEAVDRAMDLAVAAGATVLKKPQDVFWGGYSGYFADPEGHVWELAWNPFFPLSDDGGITLS